MISLLLENDDFIQNLKLSIKAFDLFLEKLIETRISIVSTGPERTETIDRNNILANI